MKVLLLQDIKGLGKKYDVKEVNDGYARNALIPKKLAMPATTEALALKEQKNKELEAEKAVAQAMADRLSKEIFEFKVKTGEKGEVFGSISKRDIELELQKRSYKDFEVDLGRPIKTTGEIPVKINFPYGISGEAKILPRATN